MSTRTTGRIVGVGFLLAFAVYLAGGALVDSGTGTPAVLTDVADHQVRISAGVLLMLVNSAVVVAIGVLVLPILKPRHELAAYAYLAARVFEAVTMAVGALFLLLLIPLAREYANAGAGTAASVLPSLARVAQEADQYSMRIAMIGLGIGAVLFCRALYRARLVPGFLALWGIVGYVALAAGEALGILGYGLGMAHYAPGGLFEVALGVLLIARGFPAREDQQDPATAASGTHREALPIH